MISPRVNCSSLNKISPTTSAAYFRSSILNGTRRLHGASLTDGAVNPIDYVTAAIKFTEFGFNHARFHHTEWQDVGRMEAFANELGNRGCRFSIGLADKLGEKYHGGIDGFKIDLYNQVPEAETLYLQNLERLTPLLRNRFCFLVVLCNEAAHLVTPALARRFWLKWSPIVRAINPNLLLSDCSDPQTDTPGFAEVAKLYDVATYHYYNSDGNADGQGNNIYEGWNWRIANWYADICGKRMIINEFGSYASNPHQMSNIAFVMLQCLRYGWSCTHFSFASNEEGWMGKGGDKFTIVNDPCRHSLAILGVYLLKYGKSGGKAFWGGDVNQWSSVYQYAGGNAMGNESYAQVKVSDTKTLIWNFNRDEFWNWLVREV